MTWGKGNVTFSPGVRVVVNGLCGCCHKFWPRCICGLSAAAKKKAGK